MYFPHQITSLTQYHKDYAASMENPVLFWENVANEFTWRRKWDAVVDWDFDGPSVKWFRGGKLNITENCLDRHLKLSGNDIALIWESNDPTEQNRTYTFTALHEEVCTFSQVLRNYGVSKGDRVCLYMGMVPELSIAVLACARIGAIHSVIFGGFSAQSIADRVIDAQACLIVTCDGAFRGAKEIPLKSVIDEALLQCKSVKQVIVCQRTQIRLQ